MDCLEFRATPMFQNEKSRNPFTVSQVETTNTGTTYHIQEDGSKAGVNKNKNRPMSSMIDWCSCCIPYAPWCWNMNPIIYPIFMAQI